MILQQGLLEVTGLLLQGLDGREAAAFLGEQEGQTILQRCKNWLQIVHCQ